MQGAEGDAIVLHTDWVRVRSVFADAVALEPEQRFAYVAKACEDRAAIRREVERLLAAYERANTFLETPAEMPASVAHAGDMVGRVVGAYVLRSQIGSGGMGTVYLAERADGAFEHQVAIKFVAAHIQSPILLERFREERRILAALNHPNIARLLDGGTTSDGSPYVVMEYVEGVPIDRYCDDGGLTVRERLALFRDVCDAVAYAHQRLVVHRDLKASNILVSAARSPKLLDFGIAKLIDPSSGLDLPQVTLVRALSLESASPEQVRGEPITLASDVYALGVLLYRLLTGRGPYGDARATEAEWQRAICEAIPPPPSTIVSARAASTGAAPIEPDLDLIVLKALRKEPDRRYGNVAEFSDDLGRFLEGRPVAAAPDSPAYRARKFVRRHAVAVLAAAAAAVALVVAASVALWQARVATRERVLAERRFADVRRVANSFLFEFHDTIAEVPGTLAARQLVVRRAAEYLDSLAREVEGDIALQRELATAYERLGTILGGGGVSNLGDLNGAHDRYQTALALRERLKNRPDATAADIEGLAQLRVQIARYNVLTGKLSQAEKDAREAVTLLQSAAAASSPTRAVQLATASHTLGFVQARRGDTAAALQSLEQAVGFARGLVDSDRTKPLESWRLARIAVDYAEQLQLAGRPSESLDVLQEARTTTEGVLAKEPLNVRYRQTLQNILDQQGVCLTSLANHAGAVDAHSRAVAIAEALRAEAPNDLGSQIGAVIGHYHLGMALVRAGAVREGVRRLREAIGEAEVITKQAPDNGFVMNQLAAIRVELGETLLSADRGDTEGCRQVAEGLRLWSVLETRNALPGEEATSRPRYQAIVRECQNR